MCNKLKELRSLLQKNINIYDLQIIDESQNHSNHYSPSKEDIYPSHVKIVIISEDFANKSLISRQRIVYKALDNAFYNGLHAVSIKTFTPAELNN